MKYLWTCLVGICTLGMMGCGEDSTGANQSGEIWVADMGEKGGSSLTWRLDFTKEPQLLQGLYVDGFLYEGILGTYEFNAEGLLIATDECVDDFDGELSKDNCEDYGVSEQLPIFKTKTGYILVRTSITNEMTVGGEGQELIEYDTIPFVKQ